MNRITGTFLVLLGLATTASGQLWMQSRIISSAPITFLSMGVIVGSTVLLIVSLIGLGRMLYRTAQAPTAAILKENKNA